LTEIERECLEVQATSAGLPADNSDTPPGKFKGILQKIRKAKLITLHGLATEIGISISSLMKHFRGTHKLSFLLLEKVKKYIEKNKYLIEGK